VPSVTVTGLTRKTSEFSPGAWLVEEPSKFHSLSSETEAGFPDRMVMVLQRMPPSPSIQMSDGLALFEGLRYLT